MFAPRSQYKTSISYFLITNDYGESYADFITAPREFHPWLFRLIPQLPQDLLQIFDPRSFFFGKVNQNTETSLSFNVIFAPNISHPQLVLPPEHVPKVFLIDCAGKVEEIVAWVESKKNTYFTFINNIAEDILERHGKRANYFFDVLELVSHLRRDKESFLTPEDQQSYRAMFQNKVLPSEVKKIPYFRAAHTNFFVHNQATGNFWFHYDQIDDYPEDHARTLSEELLRNTIDGTDSDSRLRLQVDLCIELDGLYRSSTLPVAVTDIDPAFNPLILLIPFQNPQAQKLSKIYQVDFPDIVFKYLKIEQNKNFVFAVETAGDAKQEAEIRGQFLTSIIYPRLTYLDFVAYLHSSFTLSPCIRLPLLGTSLVKELSFLRADGRNRLSGTSLNKTIRKFGEQLKKLVTTDSLEDFVAQRNSQIVVISDLPIEWLSIKGLPLSFTHDVCRVPETNLKNGMTAFAQNSNATYTIPENIVEKTLVIFGMPEDEPLFLASMQIAMKECERLGIKYRRCKSVAEFIQTVKEVEPDLLIVDCHGEYDDSDLSSYLDINGEALRHEDIVSNNLFVPLVFLSACATSPSYGYVHPIANAFFSAGSFAVTSTYLPIDILNGTITYLRLLLHLDAVAKNGDHMNWLSYVSYAVRTSLFNEVIHKAFEKVDNFTGQKKQRTMKVIKELDRIKDLVVTFPKRRETFEKINDLLNSMDQNIRLNFWNTVHESLLYTHLGRADLIKFDRWLKRMETKRKDVTAALTKS